MSGLTRDGTAEPVSRDQILRRNREQEKIIFPVQLTTGRIGEPYPVDPYSAESPDHTCSLHTNSGCGPIVGVGKRGVY